MTLPPRLRSAGFAAARLLNAYSGEMVQARLEPSVDYEHLRTLWSQRVLVTGTAHYRPKGSIQQISVEGMQMAEP